MARMFPRAIGTEASRPESQLFELLERALPGEYTVLYSVKWVQRNRSGGEDGEADFVIVHPERGVLILEVKGGDVRYDAESGGWSTTAAGGGNRVPIKDPFLRATASMHGLLRWLRATPNWQQQWGPFGHAVCLSDGVMRSAPLPHIHAQITLDSRCLVSHADFRRAIEAACDYWANGARLGSDGKSAVVSALAHDVEIKPLLGRITEESDTEILRLSEQQMYVLQILSGARRVAVSGPAGAGKTLLAVEKAKRLAASGSRTLLTCFNQPLGDYLSASIQQPGLDVLRFHQLCLNMSAEAGRRFRPEPWWKAADWARVPGFLEKAVDRLGPRYDAIVVDEAQDFEADWWLPLLTTMHEPDHGVLYVFHDSNQAIYRRGRPPLPDGLMAVPLNESWRNTKPIFGEVMRLYKGPDVICRGPGGTAVERLKASPANMAKEIGKVLDRLIREEKVGIRDIVVLTPHTLKNSPIQRMCGNYRLTPTPHEGNEVYLSTVHRYKGLDAKVVIVAQVPAKPDAEQSALLYVAYSRARSLLAIIEED
jgi:hypothetical protein